MVRVVSLSHMKISILQKLTTLSLVCVFLIIAAGSIVRMTGSGMGCPDWPKCFGHTIPPTDVNQVLWKPNHTFKKGQIIIHQEALWVCQEDFASRNDLVIDHWQKYTKHDYATFNAFHTWIEFVNRLVGAFTGLPVLLLFFLSLIYSYKNKTWWIALCAFLVLFLLGFEAWLGKLVVDGNLIPGSITIHMLGAVAMVILMVYMLVRMKARSFQSNNQQRMLIGVFLLLIILQLLIGTQVREEVDTLVHTGIEKPEIIENLGTMFLIHRSFSWLVMIIGAMSVWVLWKNQIRPKALYLISLLLAIQLLGGVSLAWFDLPALMQPVHLIAAIGLIGAASYLVFGLRPRTSMTQT
jgi:heme a synthase